MLHYSSAISLAKQRSRTIEDGGWIKRKKGYLRKSSSKTKSQAKLFQLEEQKFALPVLDQDPIEVAYDQMELLGFPLCSPFELIDGPYPQSIRADDLIGYENQSIEMTGYFVTKKNVRTVRKEQMNFGTWLDPSGRFFDSTHFPPSLKHSPFRGPGCYVVRGKVDLDFGFPSIEVERMWKLPLKPDPRGGA